MELTQTVSAPSHTITQIKPRVTWGIRGQRYLVVVIPQQTNRNHHCHPKLFRWKTSAETAKKRFAIPLPCECIVNHSRVRQNVLQSHGKSKSNQIRFACLGGAEDDDDDESAPLPRCSSFDIQTVSFFGRFSITILPTTITSN